MRSKIGNKLGLGVTVAICRIFSSSSRSEFRMDCSVSLIAAIHNAGLRFSPAATWDGCSEPASINGVDGEMIQNFALPQRKLPRCPPIFDPVELEGVVARRFSK